MKKLLLMNNFCRLFLLFAFFSLLSESVYAQTLVLDPAGDGGFETGTTFAANNWTATTSGTATNNQFVCNTGAAGYTGNRCAYVTNYTAGSPPPNSYAKGATHVTHIYRNVTIPAGESIINLNFNWKANGESTYDYMRIWLVPTSFTPAYGTQVSATGSAPTGRVQIAQFNQQNAWQSSGYALPAAYAGTTFRLVFEWRNDNSGGTDVPGAIDNVKITSRIPPAAPSISNVVPSTGSNSIACGTNTYLRDHNGTGTYSNNVNGYTVLTAIGSAVVGIYGTIATEANYDFVRIYNGVGTGGTLLGQYSGSGTLFFEGNPGQTLTVQFSSDASGNAAGFDFNIFYSGSCAVDNIGWTGASGTDNQAAGACGNWSANWCAGSGTYSYLQLVQGVNYTVENVGGTSCSGTALSNAYLQAWWLGGSTSCGWGAIPNYGLNSISFNAQITGDHIINVSSANDVLENSCGQAKGHDFTGNSAVLRYKQNTTVTNTTANSNVCIGGTRNLTATFGGAHNNPSATWSVIPGTGSGTISGSTFTATANGTVTIRATLGNCTSDVIVTVSPLPTATITSASASICPGNAVSLGGAISAPGAWTLTLSDGSIVNGTGGTTWSKIVSPTSTTTYTISSLTNGCSATSMTGSTAITLPTTGTTISSSGTKTCAVNGGAWVDFYDGSGLFIGSVKSNGTIDLGDVTMDVASIPVGSMYSCTEPTNGFYRTAYMGRSWIVSSSAFPNGDPIGANVVTIRLPFATTELQDMNDEATGITTLNPNDDGATVATIMLTKHTTSSENHNPQDNCTGGTTRGIAQAANGTITTTYPGLTGVTGSYVDFQIGEFSEMFLNKNINNNNSPLPVTLTSFTASCNNSDVRLNWSTASEQNSMDFVVERSRDMNSWQAIEAVAAAGNSAQNRNYFSTDSDALNGSSYYRLRQRDLNGAEEIYGPIVVTCNTENNSIKVYPNPTKGSFTIELTSLTKESGVSIRLTDLTGKTIESRNIDLEAGTNQLYFDKQLESGIYLIRVLDQNSTFKTMKLEVRN